LFFFFNFLGLFGGEPSKILGDRGFWKRTGGCFLIFLGGGGGGMASIVQWINCRL